MATPEQLEHGFYPEDMNRQLAWVVRGDSFEEYIAVNVSVDPELAKEHWDSTVKWMAENPLPPGGVYSPSPE